MGADHDRYEALAVSHVLGGLDESTAADFREHLLRCRRCRRRVAELRDMAVDLERAARDEQSQLQLKTAVDELDLDEPVTADLPGGFGRGAGIVVLGVLLGVVLGLLFWNFNLRTTTRTLVETAEIREEVLSELATGTPVDATLRDGVAARIVVDEQDVTVSLAEVPALDPGQVLVVWLGSGELAAERVLGAGDVIEGRAAFNLEDTAATRLVVSVESGPSGERPTGRRLVEAELRADG